MKVIICGAGQVGYGIAEQLSREDNEVSVIDTSAALIAAITETLDVRGYVGHGAHPDMLAKAGADQADMIIAVTLYDEINIVACEVAHALFSVPTKVARIRDQSYLQPEYGDLFSRENMSIDVTISPEIEVGKMVLRRIAFPGATDVVRFADDNVFMLAIECMEDCPVINTPLQQLSHLFPDLIATVVGVYRNGHLKAIDSSEQLRTGDLAYVICQRQHARRTLGLFGHEEKEAARIVIAGGGNIGQYVARCIEDVQPKTRVKIIEADRDRAIAASEKLNSTIVLNGSVLDQKILNQADIQDADLIVTLTNNDQTNILGAVMAKQLGCKSNLALLNGPSFHDVAKSLGLDAYINPRAVTISRVLQHVRKGRIRSVYAVQRGNGEIIEAEALDTSPLVGQALRDMELPEGVRIGVIYRDKAVIRPDGSTKIKAKDRVILFASSDAVREVEQLFRVSIQYF
ncbi:Trk system potassium transporter TrkA [Agrobacterium rubi]|uniref:Trk system potassium uptake protein TrkA n=1 Tax=Agrobacterium rubi TaxID=28099 RepID=A0AAE7UPY1_9HYPH|nr:Trk system potassium transporter TrkA [Agrobacterium rubi]NTE86399.1 Trk system potassium transporter TrkA [Agrobacterium rubi]NTF02331.1 Trk system potassium transporter TrkA [Agrobacterium rubi]NTF36575.1 Trk system potassium transporter TrkA [Agrobacterium rubi]OCJ55777.1 potassium transporter TrkA [Agrobacterium rubi]QTF99034.1 Trk system potassium transporter TrkA [Agrobacterium rubi]